MTSPKQLNINKIEIVDATKPELVNISPQQMFEKPTETVDVIITAQSLVSTKLLPEPLSNQTLTQEISNPKPQQANTTEATTMISNHSDLIESDSVKVESKNFLLFFFI